MLLTFITPCVYNVGMKITTDTAKSIGVPAEVHAQAKALAERIGVPMYQVVANALDLYQRVYPVTGGDDDTAN